MTPPYPEYYSGHQSASGSAAAILTAYFGSETPVEGFSEGLPNVTRSWSNFAEAADEIRTLGRCPGLRAGGVSRIRGTVRHESGSRNVPGREVSSIRRHLVAGRGHDRRTGVSVQRAVDANTNATSSATAVDAGTTAVTSFAAG